MVAHEVLPLTRERLGEALAPDGQVFAHPDGRFVLTHVRGMMPGTWIGAVFGGGATHFVLVYALLPKRLNVDAQAEVRSLVERLNREGSRVTVTLHVGDDGRLTLRATVPIYVAEGISDIQLRGAVARAIPALISVLTRLEEEV